MLERVLPVLIRQLLSRLIMLALVFSLPGAYAAQKCFYTDLHTGKDLAQFTSDAPVELIEGKTNQISGKVCYDDKFVFDQKHPFSIAFNVDLASIDTGIPLRNEHMRNNFLETDKYPNAAFLANKIVANAKPPFKEGQKVKITATGNFTVHGKTVVKTIPLDVTYFPESDLTHHRFKSGNMIRIQGTFPVKLEEHDIQRPQAILVKLADTVFVTIDVFATDNTTALKQTP